MKRVVVTGMSALTPLGCDWETAQANLHKLENGVRYIDEWDIYKDLNTRLGAAVPSFTLPEHYTRKRTRSMGRVGVLATRSCELALEDAGLIGDPILTGGRAGVAYGSSSGSPPAVCAMASMLLTNSIDAINANTYIQMMPHTTAVSISVFFGICGRLIPTSTACTSGSLAIGAAYDAIRYGQQEVMVAGGAEELSPSQAAVFDTLFATSTMNDSPSLTPRPFDADRDGMVVGEGGCTFVLESLDHAKARGARIHAEIIGFGTNCDGKHVTQPSEETMAVAMSAALQDAGIPGSAVGYVSAHGTATDLGDVAETQATRRALGHAVPISSLKSYVGHTLGACGSIEAWALIEMLNSGWFAPTINLNTIDPRCADLDYLDGDGRALNLEHVMTNNFAFGGVNTSLVFRRWI